MARVRADVLARHARARPKPLNVVLLTRRGGHGGLYQGGRFVGTVERFEWDVHVAPVNVVIPPQTPLVRTGTAIYTTTAAFHDAAWSFVTGRTPPWWRRAWRRAQHMTRRA